MPMAAVLPSGKDVTAYSLLRPLQPGGQTDLEEDSVGVRARAAIKKAVVKTNNDIDDLKRADATLRQDEHELRSIVDAMSQTIAVLGPVGRSLYANRPLLDYTGLTMERLMTPDVRGNPAFFHPEDWARMQ